MNENNTLIAGKWEMTIGNVLLPATVLGDISPNYSEGTVEANTQAGTRRQTSGKAEEAEVTFTVYLESFDILKKMLEVADTDPLVFGGGNCKTQKGVPINIHQVCDGNDGKNDIHIYSGVIATKFNPTLSTGDALSIEMTIHMQPTASGYLLLGYPNPKKPQYWDATTKTWKDKA